MLETIKTILADRFKVPKETLARETEFVKDLGADSLEMVRLLMILEENYGICIDDERVRGLHTIGDVVDAAETVDRKVIHEDKRR